MGSLEGEGRTTMSIAMEVRLIMVALYLVVGYLKAIMCSLIQINYDNNL